MSRINTNIQSLVAQNRLLLNNGNLNTSLNRLSTGLRINSAKDDPAGLIASEVLRTEISGINGAINANERTNQILNITEGGLQEISNQLTELQGLIVETSNTAGLSTEEIDANQQQVDAILASIDQIAQTTNFQGVKLLDGNFDFITTGQNVAQVSDLQVKSVRGVDDDNSLAVRVSVLGSAQRGGFYLSLGGALNLNDDADNRFSFEIGGVNGTQEFTFASGATIANIVSDIDKFTDVTGIDATASGTNGIVLRSEEYGEDNFVTFKLIDDGSIQDASGLYDLSSDNTNVASTASVTAFSALEGGSAQRDEGQDADVTVNGETAIVRGRNVEINTSVLEAEFELESADAQTLATFTAFTISGGGGLFNLGSEVNINNEKRIGFQSVVSRNLGRVDLGDDAAANQDFNDLGDLRSGGSLDLISGDLTDAQKIVDKAVKEIAELRGRIGAFQANTLEPTLRNLRIALENTSAAESIIRDTDFASETANLTRNQILVNANISALTISNSQPANVLNLLS